MRNVKVVLVLVEFDMVSYVDHVHNCLEATGGCAYGSYAHIHGC